MILIPMRRKLGFDGFWCNVDSEYGVIWCTVLETLYSINQLTWGKVRSSAVMRLPLHAYFFFWLQLQYTAVFVEDFFMYEYPSKKYFLPPWLVTKTSGIGTLSAIFRSNKWFEIWAARNQRGDWFVILNVSSIFFITRAVSIQFNSATH